MACVELDGRILIVDVGLSFPHAEMPGIDLVLPDFEYVRERVDDVEAIVPDARARGPHRRPAVPAARVRGDPIPVYGTAFTLALLEGQLEEHQRPRSRRVPRRSRRARPTVVGPFSMRFLRVTHSIPDGMAVVIDTPYGSILHTGDFKIDQTPLDGRATDLHASGRGGGRAASTCCCQRLHQRRGGRVHRQRAERRPGAAGHHRSSAAARSWSRASRATSTGSSRS